jgi:hypothetical protein
VEKHPLGHWHTPWLLPDGGVTLLRLVLVTP